MELAGQDMTAHQTRFLGILDKGFRQFGMTGGLPMAFRQAVGNVPRHRFVHRFRLADGPLCDLDADPEAHLDLVYSDAVMTHVDAEGTALASSNSQPSYILRLLAELGLQPGQHVLEIGSGSGWLAAVMAHLVGPEGHVTGIEILPDLALQSGADIARAGLADRVTIVTGDGTEAMTQGPFDRVMITAATWTLTDAIGSQVAEGGRLLVPLALRGGGCQVALLRREGTRFVGLSALPGWFVPLVGVEQAEAQRPIKAEDLPALRSPGAEPIFVRPFWLGGSAFGQPGAVAWSFAAALRLSHPTGFITLAAEKQPSGDVPGAFGLHQATTGALGICRDGQILAYRDLGPARRIAQAYRIWASRGMPGLQAYDFMIVPAVDAPRPDEETHIEIRGGCALIWSLKPDATLWADLPEL